MPAGRAAELPAAGALRGRRARALRRRLVAAVEQAEGPRDADRRRREAPERPAGDQAAGRPVPAEARRSWRTRSSSSSSSASPRRARCTCWTRSRRRCPTTCGSPAWTRRKGSLRFQGQSNSLAAVADFISGLQRSGWFPQVDLGSSQEDAEHRELHGDGDLQGPRGRGQGKGGRRGEGRGGAGGRPARPPGKELGRRRWRRIHSPSSPSQASWESPRSSPRSSAAASTTSGTRTRSRSRRQQEARLADLQKQIRALEATANKLPEFQREVQALEARLETLKRILPPEKEMPDLMRRVQYLAAQSSLQIRKFNPAAPVTEGLLPGGPGHPRPRGHLPQPGSLPRPRQPHVPSREHGRRQDQGAGQAHDQQHDRGIGATATTYVYQDTPARGRGPEGQAADAGSERDEGARHEARARRPPSPSRSPGRPSRSSRPRRAPPPPPPAPRGRCRAPPTRPARPWTWSSRPAATPTTRGAGATRS